MRYLVVILGFHSCIFFFFFDFRNPGYLYFHAAPDAKAFHQESVKRVKNLHTADCLRANKYIKNLVFLL